MSRDLPLVNSRSEAKAMLRADESLLAGGELYGKHKFLAFNDEDLRGDKENRLRFRRQQKRNKQRQRHEFHQAG